MELNPCLHIESVSYRFDRRTMFANWSASLEPGITWLRGANGAGKTTLLKLLGGALTLQHGAIRLNGIDQHRDPLRYRRATFLCSGEIPALPWLTVHEVLALHMSLYRPSETRSLQAHVTAFGLDRTMAQPVTTLSLGQHKKLMLAIALALPVTLLLFDEPFNGLDAEATAYFRQQLGDTMRQARQCILMTSHTDPGLPIAATLDLASQA